MLDNEFDNFVNGKLSNHQAPVPDGLWDKLTDQQFDDFIGNKLKDKSAPVPEGLWDKVADGGFDQFFQHTLGNTTAPVPATAWDGIADKQFDNFFSDRLSERIAPVPATAWDGIADQQFDTFFSDKFSNYTAAVPAGLWEKILPEEKDERKVIYWYRLPVAASFIFAILLGGTFAAYWWFRPQVNTSKTIVINKNSKQGAHTNAAQPIVPNDSAANEAPTANNTVVAPTPLSPIVSSGKQANIGTTEAPKQVEGAARIVEEKRNDNLLAEPTHAANNTAGRNAGGNTKVPGVTNTKSDKGNAQKADLLPGNNSNKAESTTAGAGMIPPVNDNNTTDVADNGFEYIAPYTSNILPAVTIPMAPPTSVLPALKDLSDLQLNNSKHASQFKSNIICPTNRGFNTDWMLEAYASPDFAFRSISNNSATPQYLQRVDSVQHMKPGFTFGMRLVKPLSDNILLKTGVQYSQINQNYVYRSENEIKTTTVITQRTIIRSPGDTVLVADTSVLQQIGYKNMTVKNRFRSVDVPVLLGYRFGNGDLKFGVNAGVIFNLSSWYQGSIIDTSLAVVPLTSANNMVYKSHIGLGLYAGFSISKQLSDDMDIFFEPYFRYNLSNMTSAQSSYNQKFSVGGLSIGLRFNLNKQ